MAAIAPLLVAFGIVFIFIPPLRKAALYWQFVDRPGKRKIHTAPIPLLGGVAIYIGCSATMAGFDGFTNRTLAIVSGGALLLAIGLTDDWHKSRSKEFAVWPRVISYAGVSILPLLYGIRITGITRWFQPDNPGMVFFDSWLSWLLTSVWIFGLINMINFIDGVDGLAAGITAIAAGTLLILAIMKGQGGPAILAASLLGSCFAFWVYNFYPAKMFMGDAGATFLGYALAVITIDGAFKSAALISLLPPVIALGVPILDTGIVIVRRLIRRTGLTKADKLHTHHSLMKWGLSQTQTATFLYMIGVIFSLISILSVVMIEW